MKMCFEYRIHTTPSADAFDAIANALRQAHHAIDIDSNRRHLEVRGDAGGWPLIALSTDEDGFFPVTTLGPTRDAMLDSIGRALSASGAAWRIDDA
ncbi:MULTISPECIES: hypothetical protein [Burkholderia]|uniref:Uncharacterized protein n=1 Tax=Burkholderia contaminans TaxID=488447 RepID=A0A2S5E7I8_9BURK|nr:MULTISPECIES: hypothetical protein [Burkholderia]EKS9793515.1 hypothetical protein [Burkholderia cepacia]EKS9801395.1 hypothetical protein [Burkholderia cepacia]EKS9808843.1 hypothetical protein [Burkholderia cepacia]EKS9816818.1 hypothetical protein [Burkholderia cepacia]EKS9824955.1 hypothetical protein [Burkholderia cepacia]